VTVLSQGGSQVEATFRVFFGTEQAVCRLGVGAHIRDSTWKKKKGRGGVNLISIDNYVV